MFHCNIDNKYRNFVPDFIKDKLGNSNPEINYPKIIIDDLGSEVQKMTYFLFSPTLIYRDQYPLRTRSDWHFILNNVVEFFLGVYFTFIIHRMYLQPQFIAIGKELNFNQLIFVSIFQTLLPSFLCLFILFCNCSNK